MIHRHSETPVEATQTCACGFEGLSRFFVQDKSKPTGHSNTCLGCQRRRSRLWKSKNRAATRQRNKDYKIRNREKVNAYARMARARNLHTKIMFNVRRSVARVISGDTGGVTGLGLLGVGSAAEYIRYLEDRFELGMSWANYGNGIGKWNIDHIKPLFRFDLTKESERKKAFHHTNTRPMWQSENATNGAIARWRKK